MKKKKENGRYFSPLYKTALNKNKWNKSKGPERLKVCNSKQYYQTGFHVFGGLGDAKNWLATESRKKDFRIIEVKIRDIVATGTQYTYISGKNAGWITVEVIVAKEIKFVKEIKR